MSRFRDLVSRVVLGPKNEVAFSDAYVAEQKVLRKEVDTWVAAGQPMDPDTAAAFFPESLEAEGKMASALEGIGAGPRDIWLARQLTLGKVLAEAQKRAEKKKPLRRLRGS